MFNSSRCGGAGDQAVHLYCKLALTLNAATQPCIYWLTLVAVAVPTKTVACTMTWTFNLSSHYTAQYTIRQRQSSQGIAYVHSCSTLLCQHVTAVTQTEVELRRRMAKRSWLKLAHRSGCKLPQLPLLLQQALHESCRIQVTQLQGICSPGYSACCRLGRSGQVSHPEAQKLQSVFEKVSCRAAAAALCPILDFKIVLHLGTSGARTSCDQVQSRSPSNLMASKASLT